MAVFYLDHEGRIVLGGHKVNPKQTGHLAIQLAPGLVVEVSEDDIIEDPPYPSIQDEVTGAQVIQVTLRHDAVIGAEFKANVARLTLGHLSGQLQMPPGVQVGWPG